VRSQSTTPVTVQDTSSKNKRHCTVQPSLREHCNDKCQSGFWNVLTFMFFLCNTTSQSLLFRRSTEIIKIHETVHTSKAHATYNPPHHAVQDSSRISLHANSSARKVHRCPELSQFHHKKQEPDPTIREAGARRQNSTASFEPNARRFQ